MAAAPPIALKRMPEIPLEPAESYYLPAVEIFAAGEHRQGEEPYTVEHLDEMVGNFATLGPRKMKLLQPPAVLGHHEDQDLLERTDIPAAGWITKLWRAGKKLFADIAHVPATVAQWIANKRYLKVSAEVYDDPPEGCPGVGKTLRRVAFLGGELPAVKSLADLPRPKPEPVWARGAGGDGATLTLRYSSSRRRGNLVAVFSETVKMDRDTMLAMVKGMGFSQEFIDSLSDEQLGLLIKDQVAKQGGGTGDTPPPDASAAEFPEGMDRAACIAELVAMGEDQAALDALTDDEIIALYAQKKGATMSDPVVPPPVATGVTPPAPRAPAQLPVIPGVTPTSLSMKFAEQERRLAEQEKRLKASEARQAAIEQQHRTRLAQEKKGTIDAFCERMVREGRLTPAQVEVDKKTGKTLGTVRQRLERASAVRKFADRPSELELQMAEIEATEPRRFGEKMGSGAKGKNTPVDDETPKVRRFAEEHAGFNRLLAMQNKSVDQYVADFEAAKKKRPTLTAKDYGVPADYLN